MVNGTRKLMFGSQKSVASPIQKLRRNSKKENVSKITKVPEIKPKLGKIKQEQDISDVNNIDSTQLSNVTIKHDHDSESDVSTFVDPISSPKIIKKVEKIEPKQEVLDTKYADDTR